MKKTHPEDQVKIHGLLSYNKGRIFSFLKYCIFNWSQRLFMLYIFFKITIYNLLKQLDTIHRKIYEHGKNNRFDSFMYTNKQYICFFQSYMHQIKKEIRNKKYVNSKMKVLSNTMFRISLTFIVEQSDLLNKKASKLFFLINLQCLLVYF